jgi:hypothetical protein
MREKVAHVTDGASHLYIFVNSECRQNWSLEKFHLCGFDCSELRLRIISSGSSESSPAKAAIKFTFPFLPQVLFPLRQPCYLGTDLTQSGLNLLNLIVTTNGQ